jgi:hypothetical protein
MPLFCVAVPVRGLRLLLFVSALSANVSARRLNILARCGAVLRADTQKESAFGESFFLSEEFFFLPFFFVCEDERWKSEEKRERKKQKKLDHTKMNLKKYATTTTLRKNAWCATRGKRRGERRTRTRNERG